MPTLLYRAPRGERTLSPTHDDLRNEIFDKPWSEWDRSPNAEAVIEIILDDGDQGDVQYTQSFSNGDVMRVSASHPNLMIKQPDPGSFFVMWTNDGDEYVPYNGEPVSDYKLSHCGGNDFYIPLACVTDIDVTLGIVLEFARTYERSAAVNWYNWMDLDLPDEWFD